MSPREVPYGFAALNTIDATRKGLRYVKAISSRIGSDAISAFTDGHDVSDFVQPHRSNRGPMPIEPPEGLIRQFRPLVGEARRCNHSDVNDEQSSDALRRARQESRLSKDTAGPGVPLSPVRPHCEFPRRARASVDEAVARDHPSNWRALPSDRCATLALNLLQHRRQPALEVATANAPRTEALSAPK